MFLMAQLRINLCHLCTTHILSWQWYAEFGLWWNRSLRSWLSLSLILLGWRPVEPASNMKFSVNTFFIGTLDGANVVIKARGWPEATTFSPRCSWDCQLRKELEQATQADQFFLFFASGWTHDSVFSSSIHCGTRPKEIGQVCHHCLSS